MLEVREVWKEFGDRVAVAGISFQIRRGELVGFLGPNGAGKTTTMRMIVGILRPDRGTIECGMRGVGYLPEDRGLYQRQRVEDVLVYLGRLRGLDAAMARRRVRDYLERVGLSEVARKKMRELSKGMQQKAQLVGALVHEPELLILDEPFSGLDPVNRMLVEELMAEFVRRGTAILFSSHEMTRMERMCSSVILIHEGRIVIEGPVADLQEQFADGRTVRVETDRPIGADGMAEAAGGAVVRLREGVTPEEFLRSLISDGHRVRKFEVVRPSLEEIFVRVVGRQGR
jgi:ABC-2 type transport system ATP-binding protein